MKTLIIKLDATGDVVRTTPLLHRLTGDISWVTASNNVVLIGGVAENVRCVSWEERSQVLDCIYDLVINLEDGPEIAALTRSLRHRHLFGAYTGSS